MSIQDDYSFEWLDEDVVLYRANIDNKCVMLGHILPLLWSKDFFSITQCDTEFSFFISARFRVTIDALRLCSTVDGTYKALKVYQINHQINELGIVAKFAHFFEELEIPILYINSFNNNIILVPSTHVSQLDHIAPFTI